MKRILQFYQIPILFTMLLCPLVNAETDISDSVQINKTRPIYDYVNLQTYTLVNVENVSAQTFFTPIRLIIDTISTDNVTVANPDGFTTQGEPYFDYSNSVGDNQFDPSEITAVKTVRFSNPDRLRFGFTTKVLVETTDLGSGNCWGDPHCVTFDRLGYDFQAAGEFVLVRSLDRSLEIQSRLQPWRNSNVVSITSAVAMNVAGDRVGVYINRSPALYINGVPQTLSGEQVLSNFGRVRRRAGGFIITWPDGSKVDISHNGSHINLRVDLVGQWRGQVEGLLGNFDGSRVDELVTSDGVAIGHPPTFNELYRVYGESWRITDGTSLFDYINGNSTATHTNRNFPRRFVTSAILTSEQRVDARLICENAGVVDAFLLEACILDVGLTQDERFASFEVEQPTESVVPVHIVNINSRSNNISAPVNVNLAPGNYRVQPIGQSDGGVYTGWSAWSFTTCGNFDGCPRSGSFRFGFLNSYVVLSSDISAFKIEDDPIAVNPDVPQFFVDDGMSYPNGAAALNHALSSVFTLTQTGNVGFAISDTPLSDNRGGMSLRIEPIE